MQSHEYASHFWFAYFVAASVGNKQSPFQLLEWFHYPHIVHPSSLVAPLLIGFNRFYCSRIQLLESFELLFISPQVGKLNLLKVTFNSSALIKIDEFSTNALIGSCRLFNVQILPFIVLVKNPHMQKWKPSNRGRCQLSVLSKNKPLIRISR